MLTTSFGANLREKRAKHIGCNSVTKKKSQKNNSAQRDYNLNAIPFILN